MKIRIRFYNHAKVIGEEDRKINSLAGVTEALVDAARANSDTLSEWDSIRIDLKREF